MKDVEFCLDLSITVNEFKKEIDEHKITDPKTINAYDAMKNAFSNLCLGNDIPVSCPSLIDGAGIWKEEIDKYSTKIPVIPLFGWICAKGPGYYERIQNGIDIAIEKLRCENDEEKVKTGSFLLQERGRRA